MNELQRLFQYKGNQVRIIVKEQEPWFVLKDICEILEVNHRVVKQQRLDDDVCSTYPIEDALGRYQDTLVVNEDGMYDVILESRKPEARRFRKWITSEVLPSIRLTGGYMTKPDSYMIDDPIARAKRWIEEHEDKQALEYQLAITAPKAEMYDVALSAKNAQTVSAIAKTLGIGRNKLFDFLRNQGLLRFNNEPYQRYIDRGYFIVRQVPISLSSGIKNKPQTLVTAKGMDYIGKLLNDTTQAM